MKRMVLGLVCIAAITSAALAGTETYSGKEMKQVAPPPCPQWYADNEFNVSLWGTYIFTGNNWQNETDPHEFLHCGAIEMTEGQSIYHKSGAFFAGVKIKKC